MESQLNMVVDMDNEGDQGIDDDTNEDYWDDDGDDLGGVTFDVRNESEGMESPQKNDDAMEQVKAGNCDWSMIVKCMPTIASPIECSVNGCTTLVHHVFQGM